MLGAVPNNHRQAGVGGGGAGLFIEVDAQALGGVAGGAVVEADAGAADRGAAAHLVVEAGGKRRGVLRALAQELNRAGLAGDILRQFQRADVELGAAVDGGASGQGAGVGQRGADEGLGGDTVGGGADAAGCRDGETGVHARQHRLGGRAGEDRPTGSEVQAKELVGGAVRVGGDEVEDLFAGGTGGGGGAADDAGGGVERQPRGQHAIGDDRQVVDRVAALVDAAVGGTHGELPIGAIGGVDPAGQVHAEEARAVVADGEEVSGVERDFHRLGSVAVGDGYRADESAVPAHLDLCGHCCGDSA